MDLPLTLATHVPAAQQGDRDAFGVLVHATRSLVGSIALAIVRDADVSRDIAQDVFLAAWQDLGRLRDPQSFLPWLRQMTRHRAYHVLRTMRRRERRVSSGGDALMEAAIDPSPAPDAQLAAVEEQRLLEAVLDELPDDTREVVALFYREGASTAHVASLLGLSEPAVRKRLSRARDRIRESLLERVKRSDSRTVSDSAFVAAVMTAVGVAAPASASAATVSSVGTGVSVSVAAKLLPLLVTFLIAASGGIAGVLVGTRQLKRQARFPEELLALRRLERTAVVVVLVATASFPLSWALTQSPWSQVICFVAFLGALATIMIPWQSRIVRARHELEMREDPARATAARARERRYAIIGWTAGIVTGGAGLLMGLWLSSR